MWIVGMEGNFLCMTSSLLGQLDPLPSGRLDFLGTIQQWRPHQIPFHRLKDKRLVWKIRSLNFNGIQAQAIISKCPPNPKFKNQPQCPHGRTGLVSEEPRGIQSGRWLSCAAVGLPCSRGDRFCSSRMRGLPSSAFLQVKRARDVTSQAPLTGLIIIIIIFIIIISYNEKSLKMLVLFTGFQSQKNMYMQPRVVSLLQ